MNKFDDLLERCFKNVKVIQEEDCGIYFMMALWQSKNGPFLIKIE